MKLRWTAVFSGLVLLVALGGFEPGDAVKDHCRAQAYEVADCSGFAAEGAGQAKNVIVLIGDGMGIGATYAGRVYINGPDQPMEWETLPDQGLVTTCAVHATTDSAAAATALATGHKTLIGMVGVNPDRERVPNVLDMIHPDKAVGVVSTTDIWDATPAAFTAHSSSRAMDREIATQQIEESRPEVILGGGAEAFEGGSGKTDLVEAARSSGYAVVNTRDELLGLDAAKTTRLLGLFAEHKLEFEIKREPDSTEPHLSEMAKVALDVLANDPRGFFVMIEAARIDHASHAASLDKLVGEMAEFNRTIEFVLAWARDRGDTLVIITADHETGGIKVLPRPYQKGDKLSVLWTKMYLPGSTSHSTNRVPIYAAGPNAGAVKDHMQNTEVMCLIMKAFDENFTTPGQ